MRARLFALAIWLTCTNAMWLPFVNVDAMLQALQEPKERNLTDDHEESFFLADLAAVGRDLIYGVSRFFSRFSDGDRNIIANSIREFFNVTTSAPITNPAVNAHTSPSAHVSPYISTEDPVMATTSVTRTASSRIRNFLRTSTIPSSSRSFTAYSPVIIWPTQATTVTRPGTTRRRFTWKHVTSFQERNAPTPVPHDQRTLVTEPTSTADNIPLIIKTRKFTRPPPVVESTMISPSHGSSSFTSTCQTGKRCHVDLRSFETTDPVFQYAYSQSTPLSDHMQLVLRETQKASIPAPLSWRSSIACEVIQLTRTLMSLYQPSRCLVIGVFTGLGLLGIAEQVESRGVVMALEHPSYVHFWENIGLDSARRAGLDYSLRIQLRSSEPIEKALPKLAANDPNSFDFILLDDLRRQNYLDDYEHAIRLLRPGGLLIINQALNNGGVLTGIELMNENDRVMSLMNIRIRDDGRVRASLLPFGGGTWIILKN